MYTENVQYIFNILISGKKTILLYNTRFFSSFFYFKKKRGGVSRTMIVYSLSIHVRRIAGKTVNTLKLLGVVRNCKSVICVYDDLTLT